MTAQKHMPRRIRLQIRRIQIPIPQLHPIKQVPRVCAQPHVQRARTAPIRAHKHGCKQIQTNRIHQRPHRKITDGPNCSTWNKTCFVRAHLSAPFATTTTPSRPSQ